MSFAMKNSHVQPRTLPLNYFDMKAKYLKMIQGMEISGEHIWNVYVLRCGDGTLYTGIAKDVFLRLEKHQKGKGAAYTKTHLPVELVYQEEKLTRSQALTREAAIKRLRRKDKEKLISPAKASSPTSASN
jgi:predicted GIY-YIG superfamily endonuclease